MALIFTTENFQSEVLDSGLPVLVDFFTHWCPPCRALAPTIDKLHESMSWAKIGKVNIDESPELAQIYAISAIPTILIFKYGQVCGRFTGLKTEEVLIEALEMT